jgi:ABC-type nitrate/sulfonate/bicarbonate transport system substrate-binding protein
MRDVTSLSQKFMTILAASLASIFAVSLASSAIATELVQIAYISDSPGSSAPYWIAQDAGIFKKYGLDARLIFINGSTRGIQSLLAGELHFAGAVGTAVINSGLAGGEVVIVDSLVNTLPYYIIGKPDIKSPEQLKGRTLATHIPGTSADFAVRLALRKYGIDYKDIRAVTVGGTTARVAAVINGNVDFTMVTEPGKIQGEKAGLKLIVDMAKLQIPFQFTCTATTRRLIRERPDLVEKMVKAMVEAVAHFKNRKDETIRIMKKYTRGQKDSVLEGSWTAYKELLQEDTYPTVQGLKDTLEVQASWDPKAAQAHAEQFVDLRFVSDLRKTGFIDRLYGRTHASRY